MYNLDFIKDKLLEDIGQKRYDHSIRVAETSKKLASTYNVDPNKAYIAGLIHDCAKYNENYYSKLLNINPSDFNLSINDPVYHSFLGAEVSKKVYNICDKDILSAIKYHTTGKEDMTILEKIVFIADIIEPGRDFEGLDDIKRALSKDLDLGLLKILDNNIMFLIKKSSIINPLSLKARNFLIKEKNE